MSGKTDEMIECGNCGATISITEKECPDCGIILFGNDTGQEPHVIKPKDNSSQDKQYPVYKDNFSQDKPLPVFIVDFNIPFWSMVELMIKVAIASIPAIIILAI